MLWYFIAFFPPLSWWMEDTVRSKKEITPCYCTLQPASPTLTPVRLGGREPKLSGLFTPCVTMQQRSGHRFRHLSYCVRESTATTSADKLRVVRAVQILRRSVIDFLGSTKLNGWQTLTGGRPLWISGKKKSIRLCATGGENIFFWTKGHVWFVLLDMRQCCEKKQGFWQKSSLF